MTWLLTKMTRFLTWVKEELNPWEWEDPLVAVLLLLLTVATAALLGWGPGHFKGSDSAIREGVLEGAGGVLLLLGSYFAARTLKQTASDQRANRALQAIQLLDREPPVQEGALAMLRALAAACSERRDEKLRKAIEASIENVPKREAGSTSQNPGGQ